MSDLWPQLHREPALIEAASAIDTNDAGAITHLRRKWSAELVRCAIELAEARRKAHDKFPAFADRIMSDESGMEQATSFDIATHKARRFADAKLAGVVDLCCGIGGDAMALAAVCDVQLIDHDADRVWMARHNVEMATGRHCEAVAADVTALELRDTPFHIDPARRQGARRLIAFEDMQPGPAYLIVLLERNPDGAIKLSPGIEFDGLPPGEIEFFSRHGRLVQAVLWSGKLSRGTNLRSATCFKDNREVATLTGDPNVELPFAMPSKYLMAIDPAIERAGLMGVLARQLNVASVHAQLGLFTADRAVDSPWLHGFELIEEMPWRPRKVKQWLRDHDGGIIEIKTRGGAVDPDSAQRELRGEGNTPYTVFVLRYDRRVLAWITRRV